MPETNHRIEQQPATTRKIASVTESTSIESPNDERAGVAVGSKMLVKGLQRPPLRPGTSWKLLMQSDERVTM
jgi:hypothetical protein